MKKIILTILIVLGLSFFLTPVYAQAPNGLIVDGCLVTVARRANETDPPAMMLLDGYGHAYIVINKDYVSNDGVQPLVPPINIETRINMQEYISLKMIFIRKNADPPTMIFFRSIDKNEILMLKPESARQIANYCGEFGTSN